MNFFFTYFSRKKLAINKSMKIYILNKSNLADKCESSCRTRSFMQYYNRQMK